MSSPKTGPGTSPGPGPKPPGHPALPGLKKLAAKYAAKPDPMRRKKSEYTLDQICASADWMLLRKAYLARAAKLDPLVEDGHGLKQAAAEAVAKLWARQIVHQQLPDYVKHVFAEWPFNGRGPVPPPKALAFDAYVDGFVASLGQRRFDGEKAARMLRGAGFDTNDIACNPPRIVGLALEYHDRDPDWAAGEWMLPLTWKAVQWLRTRLREVGYVLEKK